MSGLEDNDSEPVEMQPGEQVSNRKALALVTSGVSGRADCRFHKERKRIQKGLGLGQLGGCVPLKNKAALMCFPAGRHRNAACSLLHPLGSSKHPSPKGRSISFASNRKERFTGNFPVPVQKYD